MDTDSILPPIRESYIQFTFGVTRDVSNQPAKVIYECPSEMRVLGEIALNNLYVEKLCPYLTGRNCIVTGNKSVIEGKPLPISLCSTSRPDVLAFNADLTNVLMVYRVMDDEISLGEIVKDIKSLINENTIDAKTASIQQLMGGAEKAMGEMCGAYVSKHPSDPIFQHMTIYALTITHTLNEAVVRKVGVNFVECTSSVERGKKGLSVSEATNRVIPLIS